MTVSISLDGKVALVTGAGRNIGRAIAIQLTEAGASVACAWRGDQAAAQATCDQIAASGGKAIPVEIDLRSTQSIRDGAARVADELGPIDILVNCAAIRPHVKVGQLTEEDWDSVNDINLRGPFFLSQAVIPAMKERGWGRIINISGIDAYWGPPARPHVVASKAGLIGLSRGLAGETVRWGITVNTLVLGIINTTRVGNPERLEEGLRAFLQRVPAGRTGSTEEVAFACLFLASEQASYITGHELIVSGGGFPMVRDRHSEYD